MGFSVFVEMLNLRLQKKGTPRVVFNERLEPEPPAQKVA
jgi:hypothetical protein